MKNILTILLILLSFNVMSQEDPETLMYADTLHCYGSCLEECISVNVNVELHMWNDYEYSGYIHINLSPDSLDFSKIKNMDIQKYGCDDDGFYIVPMKNEWDVKKIILNDDGVYIMHKHNLFKKHWFVYHNYSLHLHK